MNESGFFYCRVHTFNPIERLRYSELTARLSEARIEARELLDGYAFRLLPENISLIEVAEFVSLERRCCPFFDFAVELERNNGPFWLKLRGDQGVKLFIRAEFGI
jgi:hypothetical protein